MEKYLCPVCNRTTYTAYSKTARICPYCSVEKILILNQKAFTGNTDISDTKVMFDRRNTDIATEPERRGTHGYEITPIAWLVVRQKSPETDID